MSAHHHPKITFQNIFGIAVSVLIGCFTSINTLQAAPIDDFVTTWKTDNVGTSNSTSITIPTTGGGYNYDVDWDNDGTFDEFGLAGDVTHDFGVAGIYTIRIQGAFPRIFFNFAGDQYKILSVDQWGLNSWLSMNTAFGGCANLTITATDSPNLTGVTDMYNMFNGASSLNQDISAWDVSNVTNMSGLFFDTISFNQPLNSWDVSKVTNMSNMFENSNTFNQPLNSWNTSGVTVMYNIFQDAASFNQDISSWDVSHVTDMTAMFSGTTAFNQPLNNWNVSSATTMNGMFSNATSFNQDLSSWDVSNVTTTDTMFSNAVSFNQPLNSWNVSSATSLFGMFIGATSFNQQLNNWNVSNAVDMNSMFLGASSFNQNLSSWNVSMLSDGGDMFKGTALSTENYNAILIGWAAQPVHPDVWLGVDNSHYSCAAKAAHDLLTNAPNNWVIADAGELSCDDFVTTWKTDNPGTSNSTSITISTSGAIYNFDVDWNNDGIFEQTGITGDVTHDFGIAGTYQIRIRGTFPQIYFNFGGDKDKLLSVDQWGNQPWETMASAFGYCSNLRILATDAPDLSNVTDTTYMFYHATSFNDDISSWDMSTVISMEYMFAGASSFNQDISSWDVYSAINMDSLFYEATSFNQPLNTWNVTNVVSMNAMFWGATAFNQDLSAWDTDSLTSANGIFAHAQSFNQPLNNWDVSNITDMNNMFWDATIFNQPLNNWDVSNAQSMGFMFSEAKAFNQDLNSWNVSSVTYMNSMFSEAWAFNGNISSWDVSNVIDVDSLFYNAFAFNRDISGWNLANIQYLSAVFYGATSFNQDISSWDTTNVLGMGSMFNGATSFDQDLSSWNISNVTDMAAMFNGVTLSTANYDAILNGWSAQPFQPSVNFDGGNSQYCAITAHNTLAGIPNNWSIIDGGVAICGTAGFTLTESAGSTNVSESGTTDSFTAVLTKQPMTNVVLTVVSADTAEGTVLPSTLTFTNVNWNVPQTVTLTGLDDALVDGTQSYNIVIAVDVALSDASYAGVASKNVSASTSDNDFSSGGGGGAGGGHGTVTTHNTNKDTPLPANPVIETPTLHEASPINQPELTNTPKVDQPKEDKLRRLLGGEEPNVPEEFKGAVCTRYLHSYILPGRTNDVEDVKKLQVFLNETQDSQLEVDGTYDSIDILAVKKYQNKYSNQILSPWNLSKATGNVGLTTTAKINLSMCGYQMDKPYFSEYLQVGDVSLESVRVQDFLNLIFAPTSGYPSKGLQLSMTYDQKTADKVKEFQKIYKKMVLDPWKLKGATGRWYKTTRSAANYLTNTPEDSVRLENGVVHKLGK